MAGTEKKVFKRLFFDIETSPNLVFSWSVGRKISIDYNSIVEERAIITICWKFEHEKTVHSLKWDKGDDKKMVQEFAKVLMEADEIIGHNGDKFDIPWFRTRCLLHGVSIPHDLVSIDTLKLSRRGFKFNSNRLDYIAKFMGLGEKLSTGFGLWKDIVLHNSTKAMNQMVTYCKNDVLLLEKIYNRLNPYSPSRTHAGVATGGEPHNCPNCGDTHCISNGERVMASGLRKIRMHCQRCGKYFSLSKAVYDLVKPAVEALKKKKK